MTAVAPFTTVTARPALGKVGGLGADDVLDVEQALLGALLLNNHAFEHVAGLAEDAFSEPLNRAIFRAIRREIEAGGVADITTVGEALRGAGYGASSIAYLARLAANVPSAARAALYAAKVRERAIGDWPRPQPLPEVPPVAPFEDKFLPPLLRAFVADIAERMQCPPDFPAVAALAMIGAAIGRRVTIRPCRRGDWAVVPNLWAMLVGRPGVLKSPAAAEALAPLRSLQDLAFETYRTALEEYEIARRAAKIEADERERQARKALREGRASAREILGAAQEPEPPRALRFIVADATVEALAEILEENPNGVLLVRDELSGWLRELEREGQTAARAFYLSSADGDKSFTVDRILRGKARHIPALCVSIVGTIQPDVLAEFVRETQRGAGGDGLLQRFGLMVFPDLAPWRNTDRSPDSKARAAVRDLVERMTRLDPAKIGAEFDEYRGLWFLRFDEGAQGLFGDWRGELENRLRSPDEHPAMAAHLAKYRKLVPALALIGHLAESDGGPVSERALARALAMAEYLETHARRVYAVTAQADVDAARALLAKLRAGKLPLEFRARDVYRRGWAGLATPEQVAGALRTLIEFDWIRQRHDDTGGRPTTVYVANPSCRGVGA